MLIDNPPAGIAPEQAQWLHRLILATIEASFAAQIATNHDQQREKPPDLDDSAEWKLDLCQFDD